MTHRRAAGRCTRLVSKAHRPVLILLVGTILLVGALANGCGDDPSVASSTTALSSNATSSTDSTPPASEPGGTTTTLDPVTALADAVANTWAEAMQKLVAILQDKPEAAAVQAQVGSLKEEYVQKFVELGRNHAALSATDRDAVSTKVFTGINAFGSETWYTDYMALYDHYSTGDLDFANLLASFNILTQYADFELLKQQAPDEAARLGIE